MKTTNQSSQLNGDESVAVNTSKPDQAAPAGGAGGTSAAAERYQRAVEAATKEHEAAKARTARAPAAAPAAPNEPAFSEPATSPALPVDEHHGKGGEYHIVDGKRLRVEPKA